MKSAAILPKRLHQLARGELTHLFLPGQPAFKLEEYVSRGKSAHHRGDRDLRFWLDTYAPGVAPTPASTSYNGYSRTVGPSFHQETPAQALRFMVAS